MSNGAMLTYRLACQTDLFVAIGPVSGTMLGSCSSPKPVSIIHIHGIADETILYNGGTGGGVSRIADMPVPDLIATWRQIDKCSVPSTSTAGSVTTSEASCPDGRAVELISIAGAGHQWPGSASKPVTQRTLHADPPSTALNATEVIRQFFAAHPQP